MLGAVHADRTPPLTGPYTEHDPFHDPFVMFAYLAAITERIRFVTGILVLPQRQTALVARQAADVELLSGGRLRLGVGVGWNHVEYEALGQDFHTRGARQEEQIELLRQLFTEPVVDFSGHFDRVDRAALVPKPAGSIPIWLGGSSEKAFDRAARLADGFIFFGGGVDKAIDSWTPLRERVADLGRSVDNFGGDYVSLNGGDMAELTREIEAWRAAGGTHLRWSQWALACNLSMPTSTTWARLPPVSSCRSGQIDGSADPTGSRRSGWDLYGTRIREVATVIAWPPITTRSSCRLIRTTPPLDEACSPTSSDNPSRSPQYSAKVQ